MLRENLTDPDEFAPMLGQADRSAATTPGQPALRKRSRSNQWIEDGLPPEPNVRAVRLGSGEWTGESELVTVCEGGLPAASPLRFLQDHSRRKQLSGLCACIAVAVLLCIGMSALARHQAGPAGDEPSAGHTAATGALRPSRNSAGNVYSDVDILYTSLAGRGLVDEIRSADRCRELCEGEAACKAFTWMVDAYVPAKQVGQCWLKAGKFVKAEVKTGAVSAFVRDVSAAEALAAPLERQEASATMAAHIGRECRDLHTDVDFEYTDALGDTGAGEIRSAEQCCSDCQRLPACKAFTWVEESRQCWLKGGSFVKAQVKLSVFSAFVRDEDEEAWAKVQHVEARKVQQELSTSMTSSTSTSRITSTTSITILVVATTTVQLAPGAAPSSVTESPTALKSLQEPCARPSQDFRANVEVEFTQVARMGAEDRIESALECCTMCARVPSCKAFTWVADATASSDSPGQCSMQGGMFIGAKAKDGVLSAFVRDISAQAVVSAKFAESQAQQVLEARATVAPVGTTTTPDPCPGRGAACLEEKCCSDPGFQCMTKNPYWAQCMETCNPGPHPDDQANDEPWECKGLGPRKPGKPSECATDGANCLNYKCCRTPGQQCFGKNDTWASCRQACEPVAGWSCKELGIRTPFMAPWVPEKCAQEGVDCSKARCCAQPGTQCYRQWQQLAECRRSCRPGERRKPGEATWTCELVGMRTPEEAPAVRVR